MSNNLLKFKVTFVGKNKDANFKRVLYPHCQNVATAEKWAEKQIQVFKKDAFSYVTQMVEPKKEKANVSGK